MSRQEILRYVCAFHLGVEVGRLIRRVWRSVRPEVVQDRGDVVGFEVDARA